jgi:adenylate cyclase
MAPVRRLAAIMFTDVVGFTASTHADEDRALALLAQHESRIRPILQRHGGREVKTIGDAFMVEFASALDACRCAVEIQSSGTDAFAVRIGIHLGDVVRRGRDVFGDAVNIASRIEQLADPGGIWVSQQVVDQVANKLDLPFVPKPQATLKGVARPVALYAVDLRGRAPARTAATAAAATPPSSRRRIAVLPMENLNHDPALEYLADGFTEELILRLAKVPVFHVLARTTVQRYRGTRLSPSEIARELGVEAFLEGSVRAHEGRLRITTTLVDPVKGEPRWSEAYDRTVTDLFAVQREIAEKTAVALSVQLTPGVIERVARPLTRDEGAYTAYLRGRYLWNQRTQASLNAAIDEYRRALALDPALALAQAGIADAFAALALLEFVPPDEAFPSSRAAAEAALALEPDCAEAYASLGVVRFLYERDWAGSEQAFRHAIALDPNYAPAHHQFADLLKALGRFDEALAEIRTALDLDPLSLAINTGVGHVLYLSRRYDEAIAQYRRTLELDPGFVQAHLWFGRPYLEKGLFREAIAELEEAAKISGGSTISLAVLAHAYAAAGRRPEALEILGRLHERARSTYVPSYWIGLVYVGLGDHDQAFAWLERAREERSSWLSWAMVEPRFDPLRSDPRFRRLLAAMKLPVGAPPASEPRPRRARPAVRSAPRRPAPPRARGSPARRTGGRSRGTGRVTRK